MLACKLAATGFSGVELSEVNLSLNEVAETPLDNFARPSDIFTLHSFHRSYGRPKVADLVTERFTVDGRERTRRKGEAQKSDHWSDQPPGNQ